MATKPLRSDSGVAMATGTASWQGPTGVGGIYYKTSVGLVMRKTDNSEVTLGAGGGGGTLATVYAAGASTADSTMTLDSTRGAITIKDAASTIGSLLNIQNNGATVAYLSITSNSSQVLKSGMADGASAVACAVDTTATWANATAKLLSLRNNGSERWWFGPSTMSFPGNTTMQAAGAATTNTTSLQLSPNVADGASSVLMDLNAGTALANATAKFLRVRNNSTEIGSFRLSQFAAGGLRIMGDSASFVELSLNGATVLGYNSNSVVVGTASITVNGASIQTDGATNCGTSAAPWPNVFGKAMITTAQANTMVGTVTITPSSSFCKQTYTSATNVTAMTISAGTDGQELIVALIQPAAGTAATMVTTWTNVSFAGTASFTATLGKRDVYTFQYDGTTSKWYERGRSLNLTN